MKKMLVIGSCMLALAVQAAALCSGDSAGVAIDTTAGTRTAAATETIRYSSAWESTASGATAVVAVNGETIKSATGTGSVTWTPTRNGTYTLTHKVMDGAAQVGETLTAVYDVSGLPNATQTTEVPVPYAWLEHHFPGVTDYEAQAKSLSANGVNAVMEAYVAGLDPTDPRAVFEARIEMVGGEPVVTWSPDLNEGGAKAERTYTVFGRTALDDAAGWTTPAKPEHRFFKVSVGMP